MNHKTVVFNEAKMNFDGNLDFSVLSSEVVTYSDTTPDQFLERVADAEILVTKEMPVSREQILALPDSVKLICEAGTGYNNLDLDAAREKGITVCNIPAYSSERVAHTAIMMILNLSSTMQTQMAMLARGNHDNFTKKSPGSSCGSKRKNSGYHRRRKYWTHCDEDCKSIGYEHSCVYKNS